LKRERGTDTVREIFFSEKKPGSLPVEISTHLDELFGTTVMGFREVLATVVYGKYLDPTYSARKDLYSCSPRSLYENGIKPVFDEKGIPSGQSGPLNITKGVSSLNEQWALGRRKKDQKAAYALISIVDWLEQEPQKELLSLAAAIGARFQSMAIQAVLTQVKHSPNTSAVLLTNACLDLIDNHVWGGTIPQALCGIALENSVSQISTFIVEGARDSASATNKTSKKPGDLSVWDENVLIQAYEVTVKKFDSKRISEAVQSLRAYFQPGFVPEDFAVKVLCRSIDAPDLDLKSESAALIGEIQFEDVRFEFVNMRDWLALLIAQSDVEQRTQFFDDVQTFLNGPRVPVEIRETWSKHFKT